MQRKVKLYWERDEAIWVLRAGANTALAIVHPRSGKWGWIGSLLEPGMPSGGAYIRPSDAAEWVRRRIAKQMPKASFDRLPEEMRNGC